VQVEVQVEEITLAEVAEVAVAAHYTELIV
jgi:hypothetical protein